MKIKKDGNDIPYVQHVCIDCDHGPTLGEFLDHYGEGYVIRAVNSHQEMLDALKTVLKTIYAVPEQNINIIVAVSTTIKNAIAKAEGK